MAELIAGFDLDVLAGFSVREIDIAARATDVKMVYVLMIPLGPGSWAAVAQTFHTSSDKESIILALVTLCDMFDRESREEKLSKFITDLRSHPGCAKSIIVVRIENNMMADADCLEEALCVHFDIISYQAKTTKDAAGIAHTIVTQSLEHASVSFSKHMVAICQDDCLQDNTESTKRHVKAKLIEQLVCKKKNTFKTISRAFVMLAYYDVTDIFE